MAAGWGAGGVARRSGWRAALPVLLSALVPSRCLACGTERRGVGGGGACRGCWDGVERLDPERACPRCALPTGGSPCRRCRELGDDPGPGWGGRLPARAWAVGLYEGSLKEILHAFKLRGNDLLASPLAALLAEAAGRHGIASRLDAVAAVPSTSERNRRRGFDPAPLLADELSRRLGLRRTRRLVRVRPSPPQSSLPAAARRANASGAFAARGVAGLRLLLVDDILTTGSTVFAATGALLDAGAAGVEALVVARTREPGDRPRPEA